jgi:hypothetical protein
MKEGGSDEEDIKIPNQENYKGSQNDDEDDDYESEDEEEKSQRSAKNYVKPKIDLKKIQDVPSVPTEFLTQMEADDEEPIFEGSTKRVAPP